MSSSLYTSPHPLVPLATFNVADGQFAALGACSELPPGLTQLPAGPPGLALLDDGGDQMLCDQMMMMQTAGPPGLCPPGLGPPGSAPTGLDELSSQTYSLFPSQEANFELHQEGNETTDDAADAQAAPDFLGRLHHLKNLFKMSATDDPVSLMIHRVGPLLILDDGPSGWSRGNSDHSQQPLPPLPDNGNSVGSGPKSLETESQLMLAPLDASLEMAILGRSTAEALTASPPPSLPEPPLSDLVPRLCVKNTFFDIESDEGDATPVVGTQSAPDRLGVVTPTSVGTVVGSETPVGSGRPWHLPLSPVVQRLQEHADRVANSWSVIPYQPEAGETGETGRIVPVTEPGGPTVLGSRQWDLLQLSAPKTIPVHGNSAALEALRSLYNGIPPQPSRFGRSVEWRCGPYKILLGCDLVVFNSDDPNEFRDLASFKTLPPGHGAEPSCDERLDVYLENLMCDITKTVWGSQHQGHATWRVFNTADLPRAPEPGEGDFDAKALQEQGQRLLHFLRQQCHKEGGTYWLFREANSSAAELFDLSGSSNPSDDADNLKKSSRAFRTTPDLVYPIASLCFHLAKGMADNSDKRQLLQKGLLLLEPDQEEHAVLYSMTALQLACSYMRTPLAALPDAGNSKTVNKEPPAAARLAVALRYLESIMRLITSLDDTERDDLALLAALQLQAHVAYAECIVKLVREACIPTYSAWLSEVQRASQELMKQGSLFSARPVEIGEMKRLSAAFLFWRLFWLCRAHRAIAFMDKEKLQTECWTLDRDLCEITGDALYGLSRYPADDVEHLLGGQMATADGICSLVEDGLRNWGLRGPTPPGQGSAAQQPVSKPRKKAGKKSQSPVPSPRRAPEPEEEASAPHNLDAMFLSKLNPLARGVNDESLREDPLVRDDLRTSLWSQGKAFKQSLALYERASARLRKVPPRENDDDSGPQGRRQSTEDQATLKVARKLAHLYNEEARVALVQTDSAGTELAEELLTQAHRWMMLSGDHSNASRVLLNLSELHARRAEARAEAVAPDSGEGLPFTESQYELWLKAIACCEEATSISDGTLGRREGAFAHLRVGVHISVRVPSQMQLAGPKRSESLAELADRHFSKALRAFDDLHEDREIAVCHFHMADLALQENRIPGAAAIPKTRIISALRHARRSAEYWEKVGALQYAKDVVASHIRIGKLLECQQRASATIEALEHLSDTEARLVTLACESQTNLELFVLEKDRPVAVTSIRREMARICQAGLRVGEDVDRLKALYRRVLRNERLTTPTGSAD